MLQLFRLVCRVRQVRGVGNEQVQVRQHVNIFVGDDNIRDCGGLAAPVHDGCEIMIVPNIAGG